MRGRLLSRYCSGQVMPLTALLLGLIGLASIFLYNSNIVVVEKIKLQNTADAAAFSTAAMDARYLNFMAYSNRAMIADHVITAQVLGIASNGIMLKQAGSNLELALGWIPYYGYYIKLLAIGLEYYSMGMGYLADATVPAANAITKLISKSQQAYRIALPLISTSLTQQVVHENDKNGELSTLLALGHAVQLEDFLEKYSPENAGSSKADKERTNEFYDITMKSRNKFASARSGDWEWFRFKIPFIVEFYPVKYGGTDMSNGSAGPKKAKKYETWAAMDTLSLRLRTWTCKNWLGIPKWCGFAEVPIGYGAATGGEDYNFKNDTSKSLYGNGAWRNKISASLQAYYGEKYKNSNYDGLQEFVDIKKQGRIDSSPTAFVALTKKENDIATNTSLGINVERADISEKGSFRKGGQFALAKAAAYFERSRDLEGSMMSGSKREFGNLYNPFWVPKLESAGAIEAQSLLLLVTGG